MKRKLKRFVVGKFQPINLSCTCMKFLFLIVISAIYQTRKYEKIIYPQGTIHLSIYVTFNYN